MTKKEEMINSEDLQDFVIKDDPKDELKDYDITEMDEVLNIDFISDEKFNLDEAYEFVSMTKKPMETKELIEQREADTIIKNTSKKYLESDFVEGMNKEYENLMAMLKKYDVNSDLVKNMEESDKDKIYGLAEYLFNEFQKKLNDINFNFEITRDEWKFMFDVLYHKLEYDQNEVFQMKEIRERYLDIVDEINKNLPKELTELPTMINVNDLIILYHLLSKHKVKGINKQHHSYLTLLTKIGERIKLFNAYNIWVQRLSIDFQSWGGSLSVDESEIISKSNAGVGRPDGTITDESQIVPEK